MNKIVQIRIKAVNGYLDIKSSELYANDAIEIRLDTALGGDFIVNWNGKSFCCENKVCVIPYAEIKAENAIAVHNAGRKFNCGKLFCDFKDTEPAEMLDIEAKYRRDICELLTLCNEQKIRLDGYAELFKSCTLAVSKECKELTLRLNELEKLISQEQIDALASAIKDLENGKFKLMTFSQEEE